MADLTKFLSLSGLQRYDGLIKTYIANKVAGHLLFQLADKLEDITEPKNNVIYLVPNKGETQNIKDEFMWIDGEWELIGTTTVDLSGYYTIANADAKFETIVNADLVRGRVSELETLMTKAEGNITALQGEVATKAAQTALDAEVQAREALAGRVTTADAAREALAKRVTTAESEIDALQGEVATKAEQADLTAEVQAREALAKRVTTAEGEIDTLQGAVANVYTKTEVYTKNEVDGLIDTVNNSASTLEGRVATAEGEIDALQTAVADVYTKGAVDSMLQEVNSATEAVEDRVSALESDKADKATTLLGYGITDAYTKDEVEGKVSTINAAIDTKADKATTLLGYGITNAYTKDEVETAIATATEAIPSINENIQTNADNIADLQQLLNDHMNAIITDAEIDALFATENA